MNAPVPRLSVPAELKTFEQPNCLLPGERERDFELVRQMIIDDVVPRTNIEWLWTLDLIELSWEILRYRRLKEKILQIHRVNAIASLLQRVDGAGMPPQTEDMVRAYCDRASSEWREDRDAAAEIERRLARNGFDDSAINTEVFVQAQETFNLFDHLMQSAQHRRILLLREIAKCREFRKKLGKSAQAIVPR